MKLKPIQEFRGSSSGIQKNKKKVIDIIVHGGAVVDVVDIPKGYTVRVIDHDVQGYELDELRVYDGHMAHFTKWT